MRSCREAEAASEGHEEEVEDDEEEELSNKLLRSAMDPLQSFLLHIWSGFRDRLVLGHVSRFYMRLSRIVFEGSYFATPQTTQKDVSCGV